MTAKNLDQKGRFRNCTIAFRVSPEERKALDDRIRLCGFRSKQEYILESIFHNKIEAIGNPLMFTKYRVLLTRILEELETKASIDEIDEELFTPIQTMLEILEGLNKGSYQL
ncbi:MAG: hypothetical protein EOM50_02185 [Erysipelotrichia bacterium]|nr:hypothetical protein [Erysipelotrichia bacterium]NCC55245.1 hypothetical protein [Erysipelotrichia bacterium]